MKLLAKFKLKMAKIKLGFCLLVQISCCLLIKTNELKKPKNLFFSKQKIFKKEKEKSLIVS